MNDPLITQQMLDDLGIDLGDQDVTSLLTHLNDTLDERVGEQITDSLDDDELKELLDLQDKGDDEAVSKWIEDNVPELTEIIEDERDILLGELADDADTINDVAEEE